MSILYPQLSKGAALRIISELRPLSAEQIYRGSRFLSGIHREATFSPVGGTKATPEQVELLSMKLTECAFQCGFPAPLDENRKGQFDCLGAEILRQHMPIAPAEASRGGVWNHLCCANLPHIVFWRYPDAPDQRLLSGRRNAFERLWRRVHLLSDPDSPGDPLWLLGRLGEDEQVQMMERLTLHGRPDLARDTARLFLEFRESLEAASSVQRGGFPGLPNPFRRRGTSDAGPNRRDLFRELQKRLQRLGAVVEFSALTAEERKELIGSVLTQTNQALKGRRP